MYLLDIHLIIALIDAILNILRLLLRFCLVFHILVFADYLLSKHGLKDICKNHDCVIRIFK